MIHWPHLEFLKKVKSWSSSIIMLWYHYRPQAHGNDTAFGLNGQARGRRLRAVYGLGLVHAGLRLYHFHEPLACYGIISHYSSFSVYHNLSILTSSGEYGQYSFPMVHTRKYLPLLLVQISPLTVTLFTVTPRLQWQFCQFPNYEFVNETPLLRVTLWLQWHFSLVPRVSL